MPIGTPVAGTALVVSSASTTFDVPYPASPASSELLVMQLNLDIATLPTTPSGWTTGVIQQGISSQTPAVMTCVKFAAGGESGSLAVTVPSAVGTARMWKVSGVDHTNPLDVAGTSVNPSASTAINIPTLTTTRAGCLLFVTGTSATAAGTFTPPTVPATFTEVWDLTNTPAACTEYLIWSGSGATGTVNLTRSSSVRSVGTMIALRPAPDLPIIVQPPRRH